jgi:hypothetical protein
MTMAAGMMQKPGSKLGPCKQCKHRDCQQTRADAAALCTFCDKPIGYGVGFYRSRGALAHALCSEAAVDRNDPKVTLFFG